MFVSLESLYKETYNIEMEASALLSPRSPYVDTAMEKMNLVSSTVLHQQISTEGVLEWVKEKLSNLGRKISVSINKIWAVLTRADQGTKDLIERATKDKTVTLPISGKRIAAIAAVATAISIAVVILCKATLSGNSKDQAEAKSAFAKAKSMISELTTRKKGEKEEVQSNIVTRSAKAVQDAIKRMGAALKNFFSGFKRGSKEAEQAAGGDSKRNAIVSRIKSMASGVRHIFALLSEFGSKCTGWVKGIAKVASDVFMKQAEHYDTSLINGDGCLVLPNYKQEIDTRVFILKDGKWEYGRYMDYRPKGSLPKGFSFGQPSSIVHGKGPDFVLYRFARGNPNVFSAAASTRLRDKTGRIVFATIYTTGKSFVFPPKDVIAQHYDEKHTADILDACRRITEGGNDESKEGIDRMIAGIKKYPKYNVFTNARMKDAAAFVPDSDRKVHG